MPGDLDRRPDPNDRLRLFCFHHAGAGASAFSGWSAALGPDVAVYPVQLPGREARVAEPRHRDLAAAAAAIESRLDPWLDRPYAFYGHSLGALLGYAVTARRHEAGRPLPLALLAGAFPAPHRRPPLADVPRLNDDTLTRLLVDIGGMSDTVRRYPEWAAAALRLVRDDLVLCHSYRHPADRAPLPVPVHVFIGVDDPLVAAGDAEAWADLTTAGATVHRLPGGHLFLVGSRPQLLTRVSAVLTAARYARV